MSKITYKVEEQDSLPPTAKISELRFHTGYHWHKEYRALRGEVVRNLYAEGIVTIADLEGWGLDRLEEIPGVGRDTANKLLKVAKMADVKYRGKGWPWDVEVTVYVPTDMVKHIGTLPKGEVQAAINDFVSGEGLWAKIEERILERRKKQIEEKIIKLQKELKEIQ